MHNIKKCAIHTEILYFKLAQREKKKKPRTNPKPGAASFSLSGIVLNSLWKGVSLVLQTATTPWDAVKIAGSA